MFINTNNYNLLIIININILKKKKKLYPNVSTTTLSIPIYSIASNLLDLKYRRNYLKKNKNLSIFKFNLLSL